MKKIFTSVAIFLSGFCVTLCAQLPTIQHNVVDLSKTGMNDFQFAKLSNQLGMEHRATNYSLLNVQKAGRRRTSTFSHIVETNSFLKRWISAGFVQPYNNMTMAFSFTDNSVNDISFLFSMPIKKIKFL